MPTPRSSWLGAGRPGAERGSASLAAVGLIGLLLFVTLAGATVAGMVTAHRQAQAAADLAALAGAVAAGEGGDPCGAVGTVAVANRATVDDCRVEGRTVTVDVSVEGPSYAGWSFTLTGRARAGPALEPPPPGNPRFDRDPLA